VVRRPERAEVPLARPFPLRETVVMLAMFTAILVFCLLLQSPATQ
jgi:hypothetical protein